MKDKDIQKLNILFITPSFIYPFIGGDKIKPYKLIEHLSEKYNISLLDPLNCYKSIAASS